MGERHDFRVVADDVDEHVNHLIYRTRVRWYRKSPDRRAGSGRLYIPRDEIRWVILIPQHDFVPFIERHALHDRAIGF